MVSIVFQLLNILYNKFRIKGYLNSWKCKLALDPYGQVDHEQLRDENRLISSLEHTNRTAHKVLMGTQSVYLIKPKSKLSLERNTLPLNLWEGSY